METHTKPAIPEAIHTPWYVPTWKPTSDRQLYESEHAVLNTLTTPFTQEYVSVDDLHVNTVKMGNGPPLVLVHGFGAGIGLWIENLDALSQEYTVYAIDVPGFGRSSRIPFKGKTPDEAIDYFVSAIEKWREAVDLPKFTLLGHSLGAYLSAHYATANPERVSKLLLVDPWGVPEKPKDDKPVAFRWRAASFFVSNFNPLSLLRLIGPYGPGAVEKFRTDLKSKFEDRFPNNIMTNYIYHLNAQTPASGEDAFSRLMVPIAYAAKPLLQTFHQLPTALPIHFIYGGSSWMDPRAARVLKEANPNHNVEIHGLFGGHHVYVDDAERFNQLVKDLGKPD